jgi:predicted ABC-type ATPase
VELIFLSLTSVEDAIQRLATRVRQGGHAVAEELIRRRFAAGMRNFQNTYRDRMDFGVWYDNSGTRRRLVQRGRNQ